jgi:hypothetical protein
MSTGNFEYYGLPPLQRGIEYRLEVAATSGQTVFTTPYTVGMVDVFIQGLIQPIASFTATNSSTVVLASGATAGQIVKIISRSTILTSIPNAYTMAQSDSRYASSATLSAKADIAKVPTKGRLYFIESN